MFRGFCLLLGLVTVLCASPPERVLAETRTIVRIPDEVVPRTPEERTAWERDLCQRAESLPSGAFRPDPSVCAGFVAEDARQAELARERSVRQGQPVEAVTPADPVKPVN